MNEAQGKPKQNQSDGKLPKRTQAAIIIMLLCSFYLFVLALWYPIGAWGSNSCSTYFFDFASAEVAAPLPLLLFIFSLSLVFRKRWAWWGCIVIALINLITLHYTFSIVWAHDYVDATNRIILFSPAPFILSSIILLVIDKGRYFASITKGRVSGTIRLLKSPEKYISLLALVVFIGCLLFPAVYIHMKNDSGSHHCIHGAYGSVKDDIQNAVVGYIVDHNGSLPTMSGTYSNANCSNCNVINISALLVSNGGLLREPPHGLNLSASGNDNCGGNTSLGCEKGNSYIWIVDTYGNVFSYCAGAECPTNNSGYQGVWP